MKKLLALVLILGMASMASATTVYLLPNPLGADGNGKGLSPDNPMEESDIIRIWIGVDNNDLGSLGATVEVLGNAEVVGAIGLADLAAGHPYGATKVTNMVTIPSVGTFPVPAWEGGWEAALSFDADISLNKAGIGLGVGSIEVGAVAATTLPLALPDLLPEDYDDGAGGPIGYVDIHCLGDGDVEVIITQGGPYGSSALQPGSTDQLMFGDPITIYQVPEPLTMSLIGLGGLALIRRRRA